jgi:hypothetical protein
MNYPSFAGGVIFLCRRHDSSPTRFFIVKTCARESKNGDRSRHSRRAAFSKINFHSIKYNHPAFRSASQKQGYGARLRLQKNPVSMILGVSRLGWS